MRLMGRFGGIHADGHAVELPEGDLAVEDDHVGELDLHRNREDLLCVLQSFLFVLPVVFLLPFGPWPRLPFFN